MNTKARRLSQLLIFLCPILASLSWAAPPAAGPPPPGGAAPAAGAAAAPAAGGAPSSTNGFFSQNSINFARPASGDWANWFRTLHHPFSEVRAFYVCYDIEATGDPAIPFVLTRVANFKPGPDNRHTFTCYSAAPGDDSRPILRGDRLRVAIDLSGAAARTFFQNVSVMNLNVGIQIAPPLAPALLRANLGGTSTTTGLGGSAAVDAEDVENLRDCVSVAKGTVALLQPTDVQSTAPIKLNPKCPKLTKEDQAALKQITDVRDALLKELANFRPLQLLLSTPSQQRTPQLTMDALTAKEQVRRTYNQQPSSTVAPFDDVLSKFAQDKEILILQWPYALPGDVLPTVTISALYTTPQNGAAWQANRLYPAGSVVQCPGEELCTVAGAHDAAGNVLTVGRSSSKDKEPKWPGGGAIMDGTVIWQPLASISYRVDDEYKPHAPDHKPKYRPGDSVVWNSGTTQAQGTVDVWHSREPYTANSVILCPPDDAKDPLDKETLCAAKTAGVSGDMQPYWSTTRVTDNELEWQYQAGDTDQTHPHHMGDVIVWNSPQGPIESTIESWQRNNTYFANQSVILCPVTAPNSQKLCAAKNTGSSGAAAPITWNDPDHPDGQVNWEYDIAYALQRWKPATQYPVNAAARCEQAPQRTNFCSASIGGYSGYVEPWWAQSAAPSAAAAPTPSYQRDNQVLWTALSPTTGTPSANQVVNLSTEELTQVHAPSLWGLSTAYIYAFKPIPSGYAFSTPQTGGCPDETASPPTQCPATVESRARTGDIALLISPYLFHLWYSKHHNGAAPGIDTETPWTWADHSNLIPEPFLGFGLNTIGNSYYVGLSEELFVRNLQFVGGYGWIKGQFLTNPVTAIGSSSSSVGPNTFTGFGHSWFIGVAFNIAGLVTGH